MKKGRFIVWALIICLVMSLGFMASACHDPTTTVVEIKVKAPSKKSYIAGDKLDLKGLTVTAVFEDEDTPSADVTEECTFSPASGAVLTVDVTEITITYKDFVETTPITVSPVEAKSLTIKTYPTKRVYTASETTIDPAGMVIEAELNNGKKEQIALTDCQFAFTEDRDGVVVTSGSAKTIYSIKKDWEAKNFGSYEQGSTETGTNAFGGFPFWSASHWGKINPSSNAAAPTGYTSSSNFSSNNRCGVTVVTANSEISFNGNAAAGWNPAFFLSVPGGTQSQPLVAGYDGIFTDAGAVLAGNTYQYTFSIKATGEFSLILWNTTNTYSDFSSGSAGFKLGREGGVLTWASRSGDSAVASDVATTFKDNDYNRIDMFTTRTADGKVIVKIYVNGYRIIWENGTPGSSGSFIDGNYVGDGKQGNSNCGPRFSVVPTGDTVVNIKKV